MQLVYEGKTKDVYDLGDGNYLLKFKDDATGADGVFDPGANKVELSIKGMGRSSLRVTEFFFRKLDEAGIPTHFISADVDKAEMTVLPAEKIGEGLEVICRYRATGSFVRRYGAYVTEGQKLDAFVEVTLKDDERGDPPISRDALEMLGILKDDEYGSLRYLTRKTSSLIKEELEKTGLELYDIKLEIGRIDNGFVLIDEISGGCMRVYKNGALVSPLDLVRLILD